MTLIVWIIFKIKKTADGKPSAIGIWLAIIYLRSYVRTWTSTHN